MQLDFLTPEVFDALVIGVIVVGLAAAAVRLYADLTRPLPPEPDDDTQPRRPREHDDEQQE
jgi:hypothetical protein